MRQTRLARPASAINATNHAYAELKRRINCNELPAGKLFKQQSLAEMLDISRTPAREALIRLEEEGLIEIRPRHGVRVKPVTLDELAGIYEVLMVLEAHAARRLAEIGASADGLQLLERAHQAMLGASGAHNIGGWIEADEAFHRIVVSECGNTQMRAVVHALWDRTRRIRLLTMTGRCIRPESNTEHAALIEAVRDRQGTKAGDIMRQHRSCASAAMLCNLRGTGALEL